MIRDAVERRSGRARSRRKLFASADSIVYQSIVVERGGLNVLQPRPRDRRDDLCGACANGNAAITPSGDVYPCVFSRWLPIGNINERSLAEVLHGDLMESVGRDLRAFFSL